MTDDEAKGKLMEVATNLVKGLKTADLGELKEHLTFLEEFKENRWN